MGKISKERFNRLWGLYMPKLRIIRDPQWYEYQPGVKLHIACVTMKDVRRHTVEAAGNRQKLDELMADHILLGWQGLIGEDNNDLPVTLANKLAVMGNISLVKFIDQMIPGLQIIEGE